MRSRTPGARRATAPSRQSLKNENVEAENLNLAAKGEVPADADAVVIAGPSIAFSSVEAQALDKYLQNNGKLFVLLDPYVMLGLDDLLKKYGLKFEDDLVLYRGMTTNGAEMTVPIAFIYQGGFSPHAITNKFAAANLQLLISDARSITLLPDDKGQPDPKVQFLLQTDPTAWGWLSKGRPCPPIRAAWSTTRPPTSRARSPSPPRMMAARSPIPPPRPRFPRRASSLSAARNSWKTTCEEGVGANFFTNSLDWLVKKEAVLDISPKKPQEYGLTLSPMQAYAHGHMDGSFSSSRARRSFWPSQASSPGSRAANNRFQRRSAMLRNSSTYIYLVLFLGLLCYLTFIDKKIPGTKVTEDTRDPVIQL